MGHLNLICKAELPALTDKLPVHPKQPTVGPQILLPKPVRPEIKQQHVKV